MLGKPLSMKPQPLNFLLFALLSQGLHAQPRLASIGFALGQQAGLTIRNLISIFPHLSHKPLMWTSHHSFDWHQVISLARLSVSPICHRHQFSPGKNLPYLLSSHPLLHPPTQGQCSPQSRSYLLLSHHTAARPRPCSAAMITLTS